MDRSHFDVGQAVRIDRDDRLAELERKIVSRTSGRIKELRVEAVDDGIVIWGQAPTYYVKQLVTQIALEEASEMPLDNAIDVA